MAQRTMGIGSWAGATVQAAFQAAIALTGAQAGGPQLDQWFNQYSPNYSTVVNLTTGNNSITIPSQTGLFGIVLPNNNTQTCVVKGVNADTGWNMGKTGFLFAVLDNPPVGSIVLNAGGTINGVQVYGY